MPLFHTKTAIIGAGFSGLSLAWHHSLLSSSKITLFDPMPLGENASGLSAGLLHPFARPQAKMSSSAWEGLAATLELLDAASHALGRPVYHKTGMLRPALNEEQTFLFQRCAANYPDALWLNAEAFQEKAPGLVKRPGLWISTAYQVDSLGYLEGLWKECEQRGVTWEKRKIERLSECEAFDQVVLATGASLIPELSHLPVHPVKGQMLYLNWKAPLPIPINGPVYLLESLGEEKGLKILGATFEHHYASLQPNVDVAMDYLFPRLRSLFPSLLKEEFKSIIVSCKAGVRASAPLHRPLIQQLSAKAWYLGGMGSKGLLYHALFARKLANQISTSSPSS